MSNIIAYLKKIFLLLLIILLPTPVFALSAVIDITEKYSSVEAGEKIYFQISVKYPENPRRKDLRIVYEINRDGNLITSAKFLKAIETQASFMDSITIPEQTTTGAHTVDVQITDYDSLHTEISKSFNVIANKGEQHSKHFYITIIVIVLANGAIALLVSRRKEI